MNAALSTFSGTITISFDPMYDLSYDERYEMVRRIVENEPKIRKDLTEYLEKNFDET